MAEKVETLAEYEAYAALGCELFQGYYFARPEIKEQQTLDTQTQSIIRLINLLDQNISPKNLVTEFEREPQISLQLIRYLNSSSHCALKTTIKSIQHALMLLGNAPLKNWLLLISFSKGNENQQESPIFELAISRSFILTNLAKQHSKDTSFISQASFIGLLSLIDVIFQMPLEKLIKEFKLDQTLSDAILDQKGILGDYLTLTMAVEKRDEENIHTLCQQSNIDRVILEDIIMASFIKGKEVTST